MKMNGNQDDDHAFSSWVADYKDEAAKCEHDQPNYYINQVETLLTQANVHSFTVGTGQSIFEQLQSSIESVEQELVLITCFWASSESQKLLNKCLIRLSDKARKNGRHKIRVFIGLSSLSWWQKLFQTSALSGYTYSPEECMTKLNLPSPMEIGGLDLTVKSIFVRPFSVMHPKFLIFDRKRVCLPSCNVSWEDWFEGSIIVSGPVVEKFIEFWQNFWLQSSSDSTISPSLEERATNSKSVVTTQSKDSISKDALAACFLPSPHHKNPHFWPLWQSPQSPRPTPLNHFLLSHIDSAETQIYIQTPNVTCIPLIEALTQALGRGVDVHIVTSEKLMMLEQLVTAGTLTSWCMDNLIKEYKAMVQSYQRQDEESGFKAPGKLKVEYFIPRPGTHDGGPVQSHIKVSIFDVKVLVLGSGNMDRASWYTSQELGLGLHSKQLIDIVKKTLEAGLTDRTKIRYDSANS
jgi:PLD-like domain